MRIDREKIEKQMRRNRIKRYSDIAKAMEVSDQSISNWFAGGPFSSVSLAALCRALDCSPNDVLVWKEEEEGAKS